MTDLPPIKRFDTLAGVRIYRIPFRFMPGLSGRVYLLLGAGPPTLVDAGSGHPEANADILAGLEAVPSEFNESFRLRDLRRILITHAHVDHCGGLAELVRRTGAEVGVHPLDSREIVAWNERQVLARHRFESLLIRAGVLPMERPKLLEAFGRTRRNHEGVPVGFLLDDGQDLDGLRIIHTPGHSPGHLCIHIGSALLVGDHVLARTITQQWPESTGAYTGLGHYLESLAKVERIRPVEVALGGHEPPIYDFHKRIGVVRASHLRRLDRVLDVLRNAEEPLTVQEITARMYSAHTGFYAFLGLTDVAARVEYLDQRGRLGVANLDQVEHEENAAYRYVAI